MKLWVGISVDADRCSIRDKLLCPNVLEFNSMLRKTRFEDI